MRRAARPLARGSSLNPPSDRLLLACASCASLSATRAVACHKKIGEVYQSFNEAEAAKMQAQQGMPGR